MTPEQIEKHASMLDTLISAANKQGLDRDYGLSADDLYIALGHLRDLALKGLQAEAMREAIRRNVGRMRDDMKLRGYLSVGTLTSCLADLEQALNERKET